MKFELGNEADAGSVWARDPSKPAVFSINNGVAMELQEEGRGLQAEGSVRLPAFQHHAVRDYPRQRRRARSSASRAPARTRSTHGNRSRPPEKTVDSSNLEGALLEFSNLRAESFVDRAGAATGHNNPAAVIVVKFDDGKKEERVTIGTAGASVFATRADQPGALKIEAGKYEDAIKKLDAHRAQ